MDCDVNNKIASCGFQAIILFTFYFYVYTLDVLVCILFFKIIYKSEKSYIEKRNIILETVVGLFTIK